MKNTLRGAVAAIALMGIATSASAQTNQVHYSATVPVLGNVNLTNPTGFLGGIAQAGFELAIANGIGTRYTAKTTAVGDSSPAVSQIDVAFQLRGSVNKDCSFYAGNNNSARDIDFGVIGIRTGNNENVGSAFEMTGQAKAEIESLTAGCNTNNSVEINKDDIRGLVNLNPGGYDTNQFQANIPYSVQARWTGVAQNAQTTGTLQTLNVGLNQNANSLAQGAWRSNLQLDIVAPAVTAKGLVAGTYTGKTTVTLKAI